MNEKELRIRRRKRETNKCTEKEGKKEVGEEMESGAVRKGREMAGKEGRRGKE